MGWINRRKWEPPHTCRKPLMWFVESRSIWECERCGQQWELSWRLGNKYWRTTSGHKKEDYK